MSDLVLFRRKNDCFFCACFRSSKGLKHNFFLLPQDPEICATNSSQNFANMTFKNNNKKPGSKGVRVLVFLCFPPDPQRSETCWAWGKVKFHRIFSLLLEIKVGGAEEKRPTRAGGQTQAGPDGPGQRACLDWPPFLCNNTVKSFVLKTKEERQKLCEDPF